MWGRLSILRRVYQHNRSGVTILSDSFQEKQLLGRIAACHKLHSGPAADIQILNIKRPYKQYIDH
jgi:hypothetical protein